MQDFFSLTPDALLTAVESALSDGSRATGRCFTLNSLENRVYDIELEDDRRIIAKFYRPGRWSRAALQDEHTFLAELTAAEVPVAAPLPLSDGTTLATLPSGILFALFPKVVGRQEHEPSDQQLLQVGRLLARLHNVGSEHAASHRPLLTPLTYAQPALQTLLQSELLPPELRPSYEHAARTLIEHCEPLFAGVPMQRLHGDCHLGNLVWKQDLPVFLDFDDLLMGPVVQDLWMVIRGRDPEAQQQRALILEGYEQLRSFDRRTLALIEPLRALRLIHYAAWIVRRWADPIFPRTFPQVLSAQFWSEEVRALQELVLLLTQAPNENTDIPDEQYFFN